MLSMGLPDDPVNQAIAQRKAEIIYTDIRLEKFDPTLARYRSDAAAQDEVQVVELFQRFTEHKRKQVDARTVVQYLF